MGVLARLFEVLTPFPEHSRSVSLMPQAAAPIVDNSPNALRPRVRQSPRDLTTRQQLYKTLEGNPETRGWRWYGKPGYNGIAHQMMTDDKVYAAINLRTNPLRAKQTVWEFKAPDPAMVSLEMAAYERECARYVSWNFFELLNWYQLVKDIQKHHRDGFSCIEFADQATEISRDLFPLHPNGGVGTVFTHAVHIPAWSIDPDGWEKETANQAASLTQYVMTANAPRTLRIRNNLILRFTQDQEGEKFDGKGTNRSAFGPWKMKTDLHIINMMKHERFAFGIPIAKQPLPNEYGSNPTDKQDVAILLENIRAAAIAYGIIPPGWELDIVGNDVDKQTPVDATIELLNRDIFSNVNANFATLGDTNFGSKALGNVQSSHFANSVDSDSGFLTSTINMGCDGWSPVRRLANMNYPGARPPMLVGRNFPTRDITEAVDAVNKMVQQGVIRPFGELESWALEKAEAPQNPMPWDERRQMIDDALGTESFDDDSRPDLP